jgi:hypothetical protein
VRKGIKKASFFLHIECKSGERGEGVPVSLLLDKSRSFNFANWSNSAGMGPEVYKTQSKHTKTKWYERALRKQGFAFILKASQGKEGWSTGKLVLM